ncbi:YitT family protein [Ectopseudomonas mendocina]|uniref:YitT family protein n=1 Tax=Ectopseudomonas mendocina TaxID=300 RepID=A0ABD7RUS6_ECTME|nr:MULTISPECIES: YitT family protein [Pseudomonas]TRO11103.1 YitT family protein [Pseudomonas mendocina]TRO17771.1 YitT family protein [Pseudomonas mendocina]TRO40597.1 YitT family protein [Pseudomonas sp. ALS1131]
MTDKSPVDERRGAVAALFVRHPLWEDALALLFGTALVALGIAFYTHAGLLTGGTVGIAFLANYQAGWSFGLVFCLVNLPFYLLGIWRMGWAFTLRTGCAVMLVSLLAELTPQWIAFAHLNAVYATLFGGAAMGLGLLMLFRHRASLGGVNILALYMQERFGFRAGTVQMAIDASVVLAAIFVVSPDKVLLSVLGAVVLNLVLAINHRADRYVGVS